MGDGRHRQDPRGHSRYLVAGLGIVIVLALVGTGVYALYNVLTAGPDQGSDSGAAAATTSTASTTGPSASASGPVAAAAARPRSTPVAPQPGSSAGASGSAPPTLALRVTDAPCYVSISLPGGKTLLNETLRQGDAVRFDQPELSVTVGNPKAVRITVNGERRRPDRPGIDTFTVSREG